MRSAHVSSILTANTLLRGAMAASGSNALIGFYLAKLALDGYEVDAGLLGLLEAAFNVAAILTAIPFGMAIDRYSPRRVIVIGAILGAIATQLFGLTGLVAIFFVSRAFEGAASSAGTAGILAYLTDVTEHSAEVRGRVMSWFEISLFGGVAIGSLLSGLLWDVLNTGAFALLAFCYVMAGIIFYRGAAANSAARRKAATQLNDPMVGLRAAFSNSLLRKLAPAWLAFNAVAGLWLTQVAFQLSGPAWEGQYLVGRFTATQVGVMVFVYTIFFALGVYIWGLVLTRLGRVRVMRISFLGMFGTTTFFYLINRSEGWSVTARVLAIIGYAICVMIQSGFPPAALAYLADIAGRSEGRGATMGIYTLLLSLGNILGALIGGFLAQFYAFNGLLLGTIGLATIGLMALTYLRSVGGQDSAETHLTH